MPSCPLLSPLVSFHRLRSLSWGCGCSSGELIPAAAELSPPKSYAEMNCILKELTEDLRFYDALSSEGTETLLMTPTPTISPAQTTQRKHGSN